MENEGDSRRLLLRLTVERKGERGALFFSFSLLLDLDLIKKNPPTTTTATFNHHQRKKQKSPDHTLIKTKPRVESNRVVVTGGAGFVGSHLCTFLVERGDHVICLDNFFTGSKENIAHLMDKPNFELIRHDVVEKILLEVDQVYHLACPASPVHYKYNPIKTIKTSFLGTMNMLGLAKVCPFFDIFFWCLWAFLSALPKSTQSRKECGRGPPS